MDSNDEGITTEVGDRIDDLFGEGTEPAENYEDSETEAAVSDRLDDLFGDSEGGGAPLSEPENESANLQPPEEKPPAAKKVKKQEPVLDADNSPIKELKSVVLSLEWEITDQVMQRLTEEISNLEDVYKVDKIVVAFLQLLGSLGKYIQKKKADAHPESISLLNSVYENLEKAILDEGLSDSDKKKLLIGEVTKYKQLKENISKTPARKREPEPPVHEPEPVEAEPISVPVSEHEEPVSPADAAMFSNNEVIVQALNEINKTIKSEFKALREELKMWREAR